MKRFILLTTLAGTLVVSGCAAKTTGDVLIIHVLPYPDAVCAASVEYTYSYRDTVRSTAMNDAHVLAVKCPPLTGVKRELAQVPLVLYLGKETLHTNTTSTASPATVPTIKSDTTNTDQSSERSTPAISISKDTVVDLGTPIPCSATTVLFPFDSAELSVDVKKQLTDIVANLKGAPKIEVRGYTCDIGAKTYNDGLSVKRAEAVADYLKSNGLTPSRVSGEGKCCYISDNLPLNRRVEINCLTNRKES